MTRDSVARPGPSATFHDVSADTVISVTDLHVSYGGTPAVNGITFDVRQGEVFGLLGTNGAGKTTTLDVLEGYRSPTSGTVEVLGHDPLKDRDAIAPSMGIMLQEAGFFDTLTVAQTVKAWRRFYRRPRGFDEALGIVGLEDRADVRVSALSGGERRRLDLTLALLGKPDLLFLDEPTTGMDPEGRRQCLDLVENTVREGMTVVLTTHYLEEAEHLADRVAIMHRGTIRRHGSLREVIDDQKDAHIRFSLGAEASRALPEVFAAQLEPTADGVQALIATHDTQSTLTALLGWANDHGVRLRDLDVKRSSLQDVFLGLADESTTTKEVQR